MIFRSLFNRRPEPAASARTLPEVRFDQTSESWLSTGATNASGVPISRHVAFCYGAVLQAVRLLTEGLFILPRSVYREEGGRFRKDPGDYRSKVLRQRANPEMPAYRATEIMQVDAVTFGTGYGELEVSSAGKIVALWPMKASMVTPEQTTFRGKKLLIFHYPTDEARTSSGVKGYFLEDELVRVPGLSESGLKGINIISKAAQAIGLGIAAETFAAAYFGQGGALKGFLRREGPAPTKTGQTNVQEALDERKGPTEAFRYPVLGNVHFERISSTPDEAQAEKTRLFNIDDIARWFNVPPDRLFSDRRITYNGAEQSDLRWQKASILPWAFRWEQELNLKLFHPGEQGKLRVLHNFGVLLRTNLLERTRAYAAQISAGMMSPDEARELEDEEPIPDGLGSRYYRPANWTVVGHQAEFGKPKAAANAAAVLEPVIRASTARLLHRGSKQLAGRKDQPIEALHRAVEVWVGSETETWVGVALALGLSPDAAAWKAAASAAIIPALAVDESAVDAQAQAIAGRISKRIVEA